MVCDDDDRMGPHSSCVNFDESPRQESSPVIEADSDHVHHFIRVRQHGEVHADGIIHLTTFRLVKRDHCPRPFLQVLQRIGNGIILPKRHVDRDEMLQMTRDILLN